MALNLDQIEQDLAWARDNADRSAQTRLFVHHVPAMLVVLRALEVSQAQGDEEVSEDTPQIQDGEPDENPSEEEATSGPSGNEWQDKVLADHAAEESEDTLGVQQGPGPEAEDEEEESE